jgi:alkanesulfonate monooxygenase SsuD/methylene tetrahydromethanopterin reductase-like flavin-dependent oxidoreductase (luciferase family)
MVEGKITAETPADSTPERVIQKVGWVKEGATAAGRDPETIEFHALSFIVAITDNPAPIRDGISAGTGMTAEQVAGCPLFLTGSGQEIRERLEKQREQAGINYISIQGDDEAVLEQFAKEVVQPLAG